MAHCCSRAKQRVKGVWEIVATHILVDLKNNHQETRRWHVLSAQNGFEKAVLRNRLHPRELVLDACNYYDTDRHSKRIDSPNHCRAAAARQQQTSRSIIIMVAMA